MQGFDSIRPYTDEEVPAVIHDLVDDDDFLSFLARWQAPGLTRFWPGLVQWFVRRQLGARLSAVRSIRDFQEFVAVYARKLVTGTITEFKVTGLEKLNPDGAYLFVSNHRDIAGDSLLLNYALYLAGRDTVHIAVGDNLVQREFATHLMKLNKSFFINRGEKSRRELYKGLAQASAYIWNTLSGGHSIWLAQSQGRAKNGYDKTDTAVLKMLTLARKDDPLPDIVSSLNIVPMSLSYEFDPCDNLKARELTLRESLSQYDKTPGEDLNSLATGLAGEKGRVSLHLGERLTGNFETVQDVATELDRQIVGHLTMYPVNYWALEQIDGISRSPITAIQRRHFEARLAQCKPQYRDKWLEIYANPIRNQLVISQIPGAVVRPG